MKLVFVAPLLIAIAMFDRVAAVDVPSGIHENVVSTVAGGNAAAELNLTGDATFGWLTNEISGTINLNGHTLTWDTGGGNERSCNATITGAGNLTWVGGGANAATQAAPGHLGGSAPNTFTGTLTLRHGTLLLSKPANVAAYGGKELVIGEGSRNQAVLRWGNNNQLPDDAGLILTGDHPVILKPGGFSDICGPLTVAADSEIDFTGGPAELRFGASQSLPWAAGRQLIVRGWNGNVLGGNAKKLVFGSDANGLTVAQISSIGFINPDGMPAGLYAASMQPTGEVVPSRTAVSPAKTAFKIDPESDATRRAAYEVDGLKMLAAIAKDATLPKRIGFFGDSITWQGKGPGDKPGSPSPTNQFEGGKQFYNQIGRALVRAGVSEIQMFNHGINGGGAREIEDGKEHTGNSAGEVIQPSFAELLDKEQLEMAVIYIGVNDAWWRETDPAVFESSLEKMVKMAHGKKCKVVIATPFCIGEMPDGSNPKDAALEKIVASTRKVAVGTGATLVDLRSAFLGWSQNNNRELKLDGTLVSRKEGFLTYDGVHPSDAGSTLIANHIAAGMAKASGIAPPTPKVVGPSPFNLVPLPRSVEASGGDMVLSSSARIVCVEDSLAPLAMVLASDIETLTGLVIRPARPPARQGDIILQLDPSLKGEAHSVLVTSSAGVKGRTFGAVADGTATLLQLLKSGSGKVTLPKVKIADEPAYSYRSILLDLGRKYHTPESIEQVIRMCRFYKIRYIHLHLSDDQLFMFPSKKFSKAGDTNSEFSRFEPRSAPKIKPYTREELLALDKFASAHGVGLIPEIDLPGHSGRLIADEPEAFAFPGNSSTVNIASPKTLKAVETLLNEVMDVFQSSPYVHLGADEVSLAGLEETPDYKAAVAKDPTLKSSHDLYFRFITFMHSVVSQRGKQSIVWEEGWSTVGPYPLPEDVVVMVWSQGRSPVQIARSGHQIINTTWTPLYLVRDNKKAPKFIFNWNPTLFGREGSEEFTSLDDPSKLLGPQLSSWENTEATEIQSMRERGAIVAERSWNPELEGSYEEFQKRWADTDVILDRLVHPVELKTEGEFTTDEHTFRGSLTVKLASRKPGFTIRYTLDNSLPGPTWETYGDPLVINKPVYLRAGLFDKSGKQSGGLVGAWFKPEGATANK